MSQGNHSGIRTFSEFCHSHMNNAAGDSQVRRVHSNTETCGAFRGGLPQQAEAGHDVSIPLQRSHVFLYSTSTLVSAPITKITHNSIFISSSILRVWHLFFTLRYLYSFCSFSILSVILETSLACGESSPALFSKGSFGHYPEHFLRAGRIIHWRISAATDLDICIPTYRPSS